MVKKWLRNWFLVCLNAWIEQFTSVTVAPGRVGSPEKSAGLLWDETDRNRVGVGSGAGWPSKLVAAEKVARANVVAAEKCRVGISSSTWCASVLLVATRWCPGICRWCSSMAEDFGSGISSSTWCARLSGTGAGSATRVVGRGSPGMGSGGLGLICGLLSWAGSGFLIYFLFIFF